MILPFAMPSADVFFASPKRVLAHYVELFQVQIDDVAAAVDYYARNWLLPSGENNKFLAQGGFVRERPEAVPALAGANYQLLDKIQEVKDAIAVGITGFTYDIQGYADALTPTGKFATMLNAMAQVDTRFWGVITFDMSALVGLTQQQVVDLITLYSDKTKWPNIARLWDGRIVFSAFHADKQSPSWWQGAITALNSANINVAFIPQMLGNPGTTGPFSPISLGLAGWGTAEPSVAKAGPANFMNPVLTQQFRPSSSVFWEAGNSQTFIEGFLTAINGGSDLIQLVTWNDLSESSQVRPYTDSSLAPNIGTGFHQLCAYYITYFVTGSPPPITNDVLYWFYRKMKSTDPHPNQAGVVTIAAGQAPEESNIELLAFLVTPGILMINGVASALTTQPITSYKQLMAPGNPKFALQRNGSNVFQFVGPVTIGPNAQGTTDLTYWSGSGSVNGLA